MFKFTVSPFHICFAASLMDWPTRLAYSRLKILAGCCNDLITKNELSSFFALKAIMLSWYLVLLFLSEILTLILPIRGGIISYPSLYNAICRTPKDFSSIGMTSYRLHSNITGKIYLHPSHI